MTDKQDPIRQVPRPADVQAHIGNLLIELALARRLFKLSRQVEEHTRNVPTNPSGIRPTPEAAGVARG